ncbi:50S ribosomal protein L30 [Paludicola sp. MB14-C6]|uniref:50S ribosomal protein L30 n=1 Tax=Paludihabitans sp. MB14-C6 TaxID=3070656 RepID=UPI0027DC63CB|nr:50S ribosomal protein L30 [Paludicola sp. MB14-C6]WMJ24166.1 50S ribosomal protein L30 [Paludicola sp. MB14-C6]
MAKADTLTIKLVKGLAGIKKDQIAVCASLGLRKTNDITEQPNNAATLGKVAKVAHLVKVL